MKFLQLIDFFFAFTFFVQIFIKANKFFSISLFVGRVDLKTSSSRNCHANRDIKFSTRRMEYKLEVNAVAYGWYTICFKLVEKLSDYAGLNVTIYRLMAEYWKAGTSNKCGIRLRRLRGATRIVYSREVRSTYNSSASSFARQTRVQFN